jgi:hypothetical protein
MAEKKKQENFAETLDAHGSEKETDLPPAEIQDVAEAVDQPEGRRQEVFNAAKARFEEVNKKDPKDREESDWEDALYEAQVAWLRLKWGSEGRAPNCPYCGARKWKVGPPLSLQAVGNYSMPLFFPVACGNCGQSTFVNTDYADIDLGTVEERAK